MEHRPKDVAEDAFLRLRHQSIGGGEQRRGERANKRVGDETLAPPTKNAAAATEIVREGGDKRRLREESLWVGWEHAW